MVKGCELTVFAWWGSGVVWGSGRCVACKQAKKKEGGGWNVASPPFKSWLSEHRACLQHRYCYSTIYADSKVVPGASTLCTPSAG